ncbi:hypothetical protein BDN71DRAFT_1434675 [Pleurotus eryngii]|uniref:Uncharacterized protein n=1 Tax=Pleurotus eryngii TaxID=5323 RepID=A0A9P5ZQD5_PLEER|nr:hypothetical protein BDN71DRAFT_1434675 [Pleurotus eryngii]
MASIELGYLRMYDRCFGCSIDSLGGERMARLRKTWQGRQENGMANIKFSLKTLNHYQPSHGFDRRLERNGLQRMQGYNPYNAPSSLYLMDPEADAGGHAQASTAILALRRRGKAARFLPEGAPSLRSLNECSRPLSPGKTGNFPVPATAGAPLVKELKVDVAMPSSPGMT